MSNNELPNLSTWHRVPTRPRRAMSALRRAR